MNHTQPLHFEGVTVDLAGRRVLDGLDLDSPAGAITALVGPNGAGKSTTLAVAAGLRRPRAGHALVSGAGAGTPAARLAVALVPQEITLPGVLPVRRCLDFVERQRPPSPYALDRAQLCRRLGIDTFVDRHVGGLSGGQQRKVAVALGLVRVPGLLILDEATTNLDETARATTWQLVREYTDRGGAALVTSHILADIEAHADRVVALTEGRVVADAPLAKLRARLGGSVVSVRVPSRRAGAIRAAVGPLAAQVEQEPATQHCHAVLRWRTRVPLPLVGALAAAAPDSDELEVRPIPLGELLSALDATR